MTDEEVVKAKKELAEAPVSRNSTSFEHLKLGDKVTRVLGGKVRMPMLVTMIDGNYITCAAIQKNGTLFSGGWRFNRANGFEEDEEIGWGTKFGVTGSYLVLEN